MSDEIFRIAPGEEHLRCQATMAYGECNNKAIPGGKYCLCHGGGAERHHLNEEAKSNYRLGKWQARLERHTSGSEIKSLRDEIGILRMMLEERLAACSDTHDMMIQSSSISDLVMKIDKVVGSCHKLEKSMGVLLDKESILRFATMVISILGEECTDEQVLEAVSSRLLKAIGTLGDEESIDVV